MAKRKPKETKKETAEEGMYLSPSFDTHKIIKSFVSAGLKEAQAEAIVTAIVQSKDYDLSKLATKEQLNLIAQDLALLKQQFQNIEKTMATKFEQIEKNTATKEDLSKQEATILKWVITTMIALTGMIFAIMKFVH